MIYGDSFIHEMIEQGYIENASSEQVGPASLDLRLGDSFLVIPRRMQTPEWGRQVITLGVEPRYVELNLIGRLEEEHIVLPEHGFCLATTMEKVTLPKDIAAFVQGRSSIGRAGLSVQNAGFVDPGFTGHITLELKNETDCPIILIPGYPVAQLVFMEAVGVEHPYTGKYNGQVEATGSRMHIDAINRKGDM